MGVRALKTAGQKSFIPMVVMAERVEILLFVLIVMFATLNTLNLIRVMSRKMVIREAVIKKPGAKGKMLFLKFP